MQDRYGNGDIVLARMASAGKDANDDLNTLGAQAFRKTLASLIDGPPIQERVETVPATETAPEAETPRKAAAAAEPSSDASTTDIYRQLADDWNAHLKNAEAAGDSHYYTDGYLSLIVRAGELRDSPHLADNARRALAKALDAHEKKMAEQPAFAEAILQERDQPRIEEI